MVLKKTDQHGDIDLGNVREKKVGLFGMFSWIPGGMFWCDKDGAYFGAGSMLTSPGVWSLTWINQFRFGVYFQANLQMDGYPLVN